MMEQWEGWNLHHLARRAKIFGIDKALIDSLERAGWLLIKDKPLPHDSELEKALEKLASNSAS